MAVVLDSSAVIGFLDRSDRLHREADRAIRDLLQAEPLFVSTITYAEVLTGARIGHHEETSVAGFFTELISSILSVTVEVADRAAHLRAANPALRMPDALIVATAETEPEVETLLSGDRDLARLRGLACRLQVIGARD